MAEGPLPSTSKQIIAETEFHSAPVQLAHTSNSTGVVQAFRNSEIIAESLNTNCVNKSSNGPLPSTSKDYVTETNSAPQSLSRKNSLKGILKSRSESQIILKVPIKDPERQSIIGKFENGTSVDDGTLIGVRFDLETEDNVNVKRKRKGKQRNNGTNAPVTIASFVNPAFITDDTSTNIKIADLVEQLIDNSSENDQGDSHPYGRGNIYDRAFLGKTTHAFIDSGKFMVWFVLMIMIMGMAGGIIFLSETRKDNDVNEFNMTFTTREPLITTQ